MNRNPMKRVQLLVILVTLVLVPAVVQGTVLSLTVLDAGTGDPVQDARVYVNWDYTGKTAETGEFPYSHAMNTSFYLKVARIGYEDQVILVEPDQISAVVMLSRKALTLTVSFFDGTTYQPVPNALVTLSGENLSASAQSNDNGQAVFPVRSYGLYSVEVRVPHYEALERTVETGGAAAIRHAALLPAAARGAGGVLGLREPAPAGRDLRVRARARADVRLRGNVECRRRRGRPPDRLLPVNRYFAGASGVPMSAITL